MFDLKKIKGIIFDYGGTIDSNGKHWSEVLWDAYRHQKVPVTKEQFREAYVYAERYLATNPVIETNDNFRILLEKKVAIQMRNLIEKGFLKECNKSEEYILDISGQCYNFVKSLLKKEIVLLTALKSHYPMILVSNFYGNVQAVLSDFGLSEYFDSVIESAVVGVRKPDPEIFRLGVKALGLEPSSVVVVGDSYTKDILPASENGCRTVWLKGVGWDKDDDQEDAKADLIITDFMELKAVFQLD
ncbi:MAG: HAD family hydrolase [Prevotella sp.]|jgi:putative hydrolase of the HAD superfamily|nr:HAD family hydrolase [Prevotella sp.]